MDVTSLYTSIPHDGALKACEHFLDKRSNRTISTSTFLQLIELVLKMTTFHFNGRYFSKKQGVAMGTKMGPSVACIFMGYLEELFFADYEHSTPMLYRRYIDDIVGAASCPEEELQSSIDHLTNFNSSIKYTYTISSNTVTFLDLQLTIDNNHIKSCVHFKPTDSHNYLLYSSSHPPSCKQSIPFSQLLRIKRCCSDNDDVITISNQVANYFSARQCPKHIIESANKNIHSIHREHNLMPSSNKVSPDSIPLILPFHPSIYPLRRIILKHYKTLMTNQDTKDIFKLLPITSYKRERNLCNHLVRASEPQSHIFSDAGTFSCKRRRCNTCKFVTNCSATHIEGPMGSFNVTQPFTCISQKIIYGIICKRCNIIYIGETGRRLADRITEHIRSIRNNFSGFPVAQHFNPPSHCSINDFSVTGIIHCNCSNVNRHNIENRIIFKLGTLSPLGLNTKFDAFSMT